MPNRAEVKDPEVIKRIDELSEANPMLGMRGCRLGLVYPEIYEMQVRAIAEAAVRVRKTTGFWPRAQIMLPMVGFAAEMVRLRENVEAVLSGYKGLKLPIGMMLELPRACLAVDQFEDTADFFSFGTNDLTQTALGFSRDDAESKFLGKYLDDGIMEKNPFETLDIPGVGRLVNFAVDAVNGPRDGRARRLNGTSFGACGEHGGDPASIRFFHDAGLSYVSCSPFRIPVARLAAAQAAIISEQQI